MTYQELPAKHPIFHYQSFSHSLSSDQTFCCTFNYALENGPTFIHRLYYYNIDPELLTNQSPLLIDNLVFHLGLVEMFSYWKLAASPTINIAAGHLEAQQLDFWQQLFLGGMGEYFYQNQIDIFYQRPLKFTFNSSNHISLSHSNSNSFATAQNAYKPAANSSSLPRAALGIGGGKDSSVMLSLFHSAAANFSNYIMLPAAPAAAKIAAATNQPTYTFTRFLDPQIKALNAQNYLNGHVPFSAIFAFASTLAAVLYGHDYIFVGNENSADQPTLIWQNQSINHQYSKSTEFEQAFRKYSTQYLINNIEYYSLLRPFSELKIAQIFSSNPEYFSLFRSCNRGQQTNSWCHNCPKCLFVYLLLSPFINEQILSSQIFSHSLWDNLDLRPDLKQLLGFADRKPFECIGTINESRLAFYLTLQKFNSHNLPPLLATLAPQILALKTNWEAEKQALLTPQIPADFPNFAQQIFSKNHLL